ncbi:MAG: nickel pincer cofactor biosynthesis protein LarB [Planctomycetaceae bacterium]|jgi:NCAIR mutase (PurE)-related protein|nr:nickel pincer cofactor biosynthesis protein LarB [Planctomycetaceae bacterium]
MDNNNFDTFIDLDEVQFDIGRADRCGFPEVVYGEGKSQETIWKIFQTIIQHNIDGFATRISEDKGLFLERELIRCEVKFSYNKIAKTIRIFKQNGESMEACGKVAVISAGTSDLPVAEEARETVLWTGANVVFIQDVGVAGPHRLRAKLNLFSDADVVIVVAGMEGALPSVVGGFVQAPVIAVPTSVGYGASFGGLAALLGMLNSCASNVTVVNIDAGFKAGYVAGLIAKKCKK